MEKLKEISVFDAQPKRIMGMYIRKDGQPTAYAFACGHVQHTGENYTDWCSVSLSKEHHTYHVKVRSHGVWYVFDNLKEARKEFNRLKMEYAPKTRFQAYLRTKAGKEVAIAFIDACESGSLYAILWGKYRRYGVCGVDFTLMAYGLDRWLIHNMFKLAGWSSNRTNSLRVLGYDINEVVECMLEDLSKNGFDVPDNAEVKIIRK